MSAFNSVLGVLGVSGVSGVCWVDFRYPTQFSACVFAGFRALCRVCWVCRRVRACVMFFRRRNAAGIFSYARAEKPNKPNTLNTDSMKVLNLKGFDCVGFVLGCWFFVSGSVFRGMGR